MSLTRSITLVAIVMAVTCISAGAQERWQRLPPQRDAQFYAPRNTLEEFESRQGTLLIKGRTWIATLRSQGGNARVEATEIRDTGRPSRAQGVTVIISSSNPAGESRCLIDYEEIDALVKAFDAMAKAEDSVTRLSNFEEHYRTSSDFEIIVFKQTSGGIAAAIEGGFFERTRVLMTLEEFSRLRWMIVQAKEKIDEVK